MEIVVYNRAVLLFMTDAEAVRRLAGNDKRERPLGPLPSFAVGHLAPRYQNMDESSRNAPLGEAGAQTSAAFFTPNVCKPNWSFTLKLVDPPVHFETL